MWRLTFGAAVIACGACGSATRAPMAYTGPPISLEPGGEELAPPPRAPVTESSPSKPAAPQVGPTSQGFDGPQSVGDLPDPEPLSEVAHWQYSISYDRGVIDAGEPRLNCLERPTPAARKIGRFAFELWLGRELIERVRFDVPLLAAEVPPTGSRRDLHEAPRFGPGARSRVDLSIPASDRATSARILDRATREVVAVPWPPSAAEPGAELCRRGDAG